MSTCVLLRQTNQRTNMTIEIITFWVSDYLAELVMDVDFFKTELEAKNRNFYASGVYPTMFKHTLNMEELSKLSNEITILNNIHDFDNPNVFHEIIKDLKLKYPKLKRI